MALATWRSLGTIFLTVIFSTLLAGALGFGLFFIWNLEQRSDHIPDSGCLVAIQSPLTCYAPPERLTAEPTTAIAVSPDGTLLASSVQRRIYLWDLATRRLVRSFPAHRDWITALTFSPDGQTLASSGLDQTINLWAVATGTLERAIAAGRITALAFSPDGQVLAGGSRFERWYDGSLPPQGVLRWEVATGRSLPTLGSEPVTNLAFSPDGRFLASGTDRTQLWDLQQGRVAYTLSSGGLTSLAFTADGETLITGSSRTKFWNLQTGRLRKTLKASSADLLLNPSGRMLVVASGGTIKFWDLNPTELLGSLRGSHYSALEVRLGLQGQVLIAASSDGLQLWRQTTSAPVGS